MRTNKSRTLLKSLAVLAAGLLCAAAAYAGTYSNNFSDPTPTGFTLNGGVRADGVSPYPAIENGYLALTYAENSLQGSIVFDELDPGAAIGSFTVTFIMRIGGGSSTPADGMAFYFGTGIDSTANFGEEGPSGGTGITVSFDTFDNGGGEAPAIDIKVNDNVVAHKVVDVFYLLTDAFTNVVIQLNANGTMNVAYKGQVVYTNQYLEGYTPITGGRFAMGARTGGLNENLWIDNLSITTVVAGAPAAPTISAQNQPQSQTINERSSVTFSVLPDGMPPFSFQWLSNNVAIADATSRIYTIASVPFTANAAKYTVQVSNGVGSITSAEATLTVNQDVTAPTIASVSGSETFSLVTAVFSEPVTPATAGASGNYGLSGGLTIQNVTVVNATTVQLTTSAQTPGTVYTLTVNGVQDTASIANTIAAGSTKDFTAWTLSLGFLKFEIWSGLSTGDNSLDNTLLADPRYPNAPDMIAYTTPFTSRGVYPNDSHEGYGGRMSGFVTPAESADYRFFIYSDDSSRLFLSTDASPQNVTLIAEEAGCCNPFTEPESPRTSSPIPLVAGQRYYVEIIWKEGTGGDYALVGWRKEGDLTPAGSLPPIPSRFLSAYADPGVASVSITQQPANAATTENKTATFSVTATGSPAPVLYQWQRAEPGSATFADVTGANSAAYTTPTLKRALDNGAKYRCIVSVPGKSTPSAEVSLTVDIDTTPPSVVSAAGGDNLKSVTLVFSEPLAPVGAGMSGNYSIPGLTITAAAVVNPTTVRLTTSQQTENTSYTVTVNANVTDTAIPANAMDPAGNSKSFTSLIRLTGILKWQAYTGIGGTPVAGLTGNAKYPNSPDDTRLIVGFDSPSAYGENFGARISGFVTPTETGDYDFFIRSDDASQLFLSTNDDPADLSATPIAQETGCCAGFQETGAGAEETTAAPIHLEAGQRYYIVALYKEAGGGDYCQVAWRKTDDPTAAGDLRPIAPAFVSAAVSQANLDTITVPAVLATPVGSGDATKPGFKARVYQVNQQGGTATINRVSRAEQELAGAIGPNVADLTGAVDGIFNVDTIINWNQD
ncbi:MAG: hypothetical protein HY674_04580, partial [Chloroflexi bacterium]|nr:hypothetical protein [Chloroflexota bacterium]